MTNTYTMELHDSVIELQRASERIADRIERKYNRHARAEFSRREIERETDAEIRAALRGEGRTA